MEHRRILAAAAAADPELEAIVCSGIQKLLPTLDHDQAQLVRRIDLQGESVRGVAASLDLEADTAIDRLLAVRRALRARLGEMCFAGSGPAAGTCGCTEMRDPDPGRSRLH